MKNFQKPKRYESFKIDLSLMDLLRKYAKDDRRTIKETMEQTLRDGFKARTPDAKV